MGKSKYNDTIFITLTNSGYIHYTLNCLKSLENINFEMKLKCYCLGKEGFNTLKSKKYESRLVKNSEELSKFKQWKENGVESIYSQKFPIIYKNLLKYKFVCFTDGDIVYQNNKFLDYCLSDIGDNDLLIQNDTCKNSDNRVVCSGFMFIRSNEKTLNLFNPKNIVKSTKVKKWGDQVYVNEIKKKLNFKTLPLELFPNGKYYYLNNEVLEKNSKKPYMIHFNWVIGSKKKKKMKKYNKWYI